MWKAYIYEYFAEVFLCVCVMSVNFLLESVLGDVIVKGIVEQQQNPSVACQIILQHYSVLNEYDIS